MTSVSQQDNFAWSLSTSSVVFSSCLPASSSFSSSIQTLFIYQSSPSLKLIELTDKHRGLPARPARRRFSSQLEAIYTSLSSSRDGRMILNLMRRSERRLVAPGHLTRTTATLVHIALPACPSDSSTCASVQVSGCPSGRQTTCWPTLNERWPPGKGNSINGRRGGAARAKATARERRTTRRRIPSES